MDQKWIQVLVILVFHQNMTPGAGEDITVKEGHSVDIKCEPSEMGLCVVWFRALDQSGMEFIASFSNNGQEKSIPSSYSSTFSHTKMEQKILTLKRFNKGRDSGLYSCAALYKGNELRFGKVTRLLGDKVAPLTTTTTKPNLFTTTSVQCVCEKQGGTSSFMFCSPIILGSLAGGCGLLLVLLIFTILYCNKKRTRRCPHHYKRKPRMPPGK